MINHKDLKNISSIYKTDKLEHGYIEIYESYFNQIKDKELKILEIGIADGKSLLTWSDYFKNSKIIGIDIHKIDIVEKKLDRKNIEVHQGSQSDRQFIQEIVKKYNDFDIIIDDGSHISKDVKKSFELLFPALKDNGLYIVEDMQTSYNHFFGGNPFDLKYSNSHMNFFKNLFTSFLVNGCEKDEEEDDQGLNGFENFVAVSCDIQSIEVLYLHHAGHLRASYINNNGKLNGEWIVP